MPELSIIIPVYNSEKYLQQCIDSVLSQNYTNFEIIAIDDCSVDGSMDIIRNYEQQDSRIKSYRTNVNGVSKARNLGIEKSGGRYVMFLDSDDMLLDNSLGRVWEKTEKYKPDILVFGGKTTSKNAEKDWMKACLNPKEEYVTDFRPHMIFEKRGTLPVTWNKLFKREMLVNNNITFPEELAVAEDQAFQVKAFLHAKNVIYTKEKVYIYRLQVENSAMSRYDRKLTEKFRQHMVCSDIIAGSFKKCGCKKDCHGYLIDFLYDTIISNPSPIRHEMAQEAMEFFKKENIMPQEEKAGSGRYDIIEAYSISEEKGRKIHKSYMGGIMGKIRFHRKKISRYGLDIYFK